jgi:hypothetical protein
MNNGLLEREHSFVGRKRGSITLKISFAESNISLL